MKTHKKLDKRIRMYINLNNNWKHKQKKKKTWSAIGPRSQNTYFKITQANYTTPKKRKRKKRDNKNTKSERQLWRVKNQELCNVRDLLGSELQ